MKRGLGYLFLGVLLIGGMIKLQGNVVGNQRKAELGASVSTCLDYLEPSL